LMYSSSSPSSWSIRSGNHPPPRCRARISDTISGWRANCAACQTRQPRCRYSFHPVATITTEVVRQGVALCCIV
jgi:hypothetical protein